MGASNAGHVRVESGRVWGFRFPIWLPRPHTQYYLIAEDLCPLLGVEDNGIAIQLLDEYLRRAGTTHGVDTDGEAGCVYVTSRSAKGILHAALAINALASPDQHAEVNGQFLAALRKALRVPRVRALRWAVGDVFQIPLGSGRWMYGQVLGAHPSCCLFQGTFTGPSSPHAVTDLRPLSILHVAPDLLAAGRWPIVGNTVPSATVKAMVSDPLQDPGVWWASVRTPEELKKALESGARTRGAWSSGQVLQHLAEALNGLRPWNVGLMGTDEFYDALLLSGVKRPDSAWILSPAERERYRNENGITA